MDTLKVAELCFPQLTNNSCKKPSQKNFENIFIYVLLSCICFLTVILNLLVIISISHFRQLHTPSNLFLRSLALSDFLVGLVVMPVRMLLTESCWFFGSFMCGLCNYISFVITSASVGNMVLISADRYVAICEPLTYPNKVTQSRVQVCVGLCWACSALYNGVILRDHLQNPDKYNLCHGECVILIDFLTGAFDLIITFFGPVSAIVFMYMRVFVVAVSQARAMRSHVAAVGLKGSAPASAQRSERKAATAVGVVVMVFVFSFCPYYYPSFAGKDLLSSEVVSNLVIWLFYLNSCLNPMIYAFFYPWFRKSLKYIVTLQILQSDSCHFNIL
ncbi:trace amine-associated receptor 13c-like [Nematolebias whitei]|uniref:trace amine-associated receptor 13c-like n=1 Tax=Nematolebias whitei TaxID=451745 RepID=UPI001896C13A|nr:trace amine-associated receptor 13c-like [Nematolebias whitei]